MPVGRRLMSWLGAVGGAALVAALAGLISGVASRTLYILGLYEVAAGLTLGVVAVAWLHLLRVRDPRLLWVTAAVIGVVWLGCHRGAEAWLFRLEQGRQIGEHGLLLAEEAVLHDQDDPLSLIDASLMAETGADGVRGAAALLLGRGLTVQRVLGVDRVLPAPPWLHALLYAAQALAVTFFVGRALAGMALEPICPVCDAWLRRRRLGGLSEAQGHALAQAWRRGQRPSPPQAVARPGAGEPLLLFEDRCPRGHETGPGWELRRRRRLRFGASAPGRWAAMSPQWPALNRARVESTPPGPA